MERNVFICIIVSMCIIAASSTSSSKKSHGKLNETPSQSITLISSDSPASFNATVKVDKPTQLLNETISKRSSRARLKERRYVPYYPSPQNAPAAANDYCPPLASSCPLCLSFSSQLPEDICSYSVVMKVLMLSPPSTDVYGKVCGKLGLLAGLANTDIKQYRRLLRLSVPESCQCILSASTQYILISKPSAFLKDGSLNSKISLSDEVIMLPVDRYTEAVTLKPLEQCHLKPLPDAHGQQSSEYIEQPIQPRNYREKVPPPPNPPPPDLYLPSYPPSNLYPYFQPPDPPSPTFYVPPYPPMSFPLAGPVTYKLPSFLPLFANCLQEESCPKCVQPSEVNLEQEYCTSDFAYIALVTFPDLSKAKGDYSNPYYAGSCLNIRTTVLHDVSKNSDAKLLSIQLNLLLPTQCGCFPQLKGFAIVLLLGHYTNTPLYEASTQLKKEFTLVYLPAPSEISIPNCVSYSPPTPYVPQEQDSQVNPIPNCPYGFETSCPSCSALPDQAFLNQFCAAKIAIVAELQGSGSYAVLAPKIPSVQITTSEDQYSYKSISVKVMKSSPPSCIEGSLKVLQVVKPQQDYYTLPSIIGFTVLSECLLECPLLTAPGTKLLIYSSKDTTLLPNGVIQLTDGVYLTPLGIYDTLPVCPEQYFENSVPYMPPTSSPAQFPDYPTVYSVVASMVDNPDIPPASIYKSDPLPAPIYPKEYVPSYETAPSPPAPYETAPQLPAPYETAPKPPAPYEAAPTSPPASYEKAPPPPPVPYEKASPPPTPVPYEKAPPPPPTPVPYENTPPPPPIPYETVPSPAAPYEKAPTPPEPYEKTSPPIAPYETVPSPPIPPVPYEKAPTPPPLTYEKAPPPPVPYEKSPPPPVPYEKSPPPPVPYEKTAPPPPLSYEKAPPPTPVPYEKAAPPPSVSYETASTPQYKTAPAPPPYVTAAPPPYSPPSQPPPIAAPPSPYIAAPSPPYTAPPNPPTPYTGAPTPPYTPVPKLPVATTLPPYNAAPPPYASVPFPPPVIPPKTTVPHSSPYAFAEYKPCLENDFSCPECSYSLPPNFKDAYCTANTAILVAIGLNYATYKEYEDTMQLAFKPLGPHHINIQPGVYNPGLDVTVSSYTPFDVISKQNAVANQLCFKDTVRALYDVTRGNEPKKLSLDFDVYVPALCPDCPVFLQSPTYAVLLSKKSLYLNGAIQLTNQFGFYPLPKETFSLPDCYSEYSTEPFYSILSVDKYQVPAYPAGKLLSCDYPPVCQKCPDPPLYPYFEIPCDQKLALVVEILETSTGKPGAPTLEITVYQKHMDYYATYIVSLNIKDSPPALDTSGPYKSASSCKYAKVKVIQDLSPYPAVLPGTILTVLAASDCDCNIFSISQGFGILLAPEYSGTTITIGPASAIILPIGYSSISLCSFNPSPTYSPPVPPAYPPPVLPTYAPPIPPTYAPPVPPTYAPSVPPTPPPVPSYPPPDPPIYPPKVPPIVAPLPAPITNPPLVPPVQPVTKPPLPPPAQVDLKYGLQTGSVPTLPCVENSGCTICGNSAAITENPDVYCDSLLVFLVRISKIENDKEGQCTSGAAISMYEITASKPAQKAVINIFFTLPQKCLCPQLVVDKFALLMFHKSITITNPLVLNLDSSFHLYSVPTGRLTLPFCAISQFASRTKDLDEIFVDPVDNELTLLRRKELNLEKCPTNERTCPNCDYMDTEDLKELICSSDFAFEVTMNPKLNQERPANNFSIDIVVKPYDGPDACNIPVEEGNCNSELRKFYYDADDQECKEFIYSGCNGNANNFNSYMECEESCLTEGYCDKGDLYVQNNPRNKFSENWNKNELKYFIGEDCDCPSLIPDPYCKYLVYNSTEIKHKKAMHLSKDFYFIPLTDSQRAAPITCDSDSNNVYTSQEPHLDENNGEYDKNNIITDDVKDFTIRYDTATKNDEDYSYGTKYDVNNDSQKNLDDIFESKYDDNDDFTNDTYATSENERTKYEKNYDIGEIPDLENNIVKNMTNEYETNDELASDEDTEEPETKSRGWFG
ncbi:uncharacterized protein [Parasteatoda tepidariorum]|uniref:uncharacterized protein isoform X2 n=1 Tax=Parasteatoda tepidariorum TaxID=114398 RepID=UPI00077FE1CC|nr:uncharacterized protein LOC107446702 isoform X2 [Parasteatoda tepidariorum]